MTAVASHLLFVKLLGSRRRVSGQDEAGQPLNFTRRFLARILLLPRRSLGRTGLRLSFSADHRVIASRIRLATEPEFEAGHLARESGFDQTCWPPRRSNRGAFIWNYERNAGRTGRGPGATCLAKTPRRFANLLQRSSAKRGKPAHEGHYAPPPGRVDPNSSGRILSTDSHSRSMMPWSFCALSLLK